LPPRQPLLSSGKIEHIQRLVRSVQLLKARCAFPQRIHQALRSYSHPLRRPKACRCGLRITLFQAG